MDTDNGFLIHKRNYL